jgi:hypothetical protein
MYFFSVQFLPGQHLPAGVNEWLTIRNLDREFFKWLLICRDSDRPGSGGGRVATSSGGGAARKRQYRGKAPFAAAVVFPPQGASMERRGWRFGRHRRI